MSPVGRRRMTSFARSSTRRTGPHWQEAHRRTGALLQEELDKLIKQYAATTSSAKQHSIVNKLEAAMVWDVPIIPITEGVDWYQYNTKSLSGWVTRRTRS